MSKLVDRFPTARHIFVSDASVDDPKQLLTLVEPYLDWVLAEVDTQSTDILIWNQAANGSHPGEYTMVILSGKLVTIWLEHRKPRPAPT
jgi:hypothetical protein